MLRLGRARDAAIYAKMDVATRARPYIFRSSQPFSSQFYATDFGLYCSTLIDVCLSVAFTVAYGNPTYLTFNRNGGFRLLKYNTEIFCSRDIRVIWESLQSCSTKNVPKFYSGVDATALNRPTCRMPVMDHRLLHQN